MPHNELLLKLRRLGACGDVWLGLKEDCSVCQLMITSQVFCPYCQVCQRGASWGHCYSINDLPLSVHSVRISLFSDDTKCKQLIRNVQDCISLQDDLDSMGRWSITWKLLFKEAKCALLRLCQARRKQNHSATVKFFSGADCVL